MDAIVHSAPSSGYRSRQLGASRATATWDDSRRRCQNKRLRGQTLARQVRKQPREVEAVQTEGRERTTDHARWDHKLPEGRLGQASQDGQRRIGPLRRRVQLLRRPRDARQPTVGGQGFEGRAVASITLPNEEGSHSRALAEGDGGEEREEGRETHRRGSVGR